MLLVLVRGLVLGSFLLLTAARAGLVEEYKRDASVLVATLDVKSGELECSDDGRCARLLPPCSTFKIPNAVIGLETGVVTGLDWTLKYDPNRNPAQPDWPAGWAQDHDLRSAMKRSAVWYFQEIARQVGEERYKSFLARFDYGNRDLSGGVDKFWLSSSLRLSAAQQLTFLRKFWRQELPGASPRSIDLTKEAILLEQGEGWAWRGKTGSGPIPGTQRWVGWHVGGVETPRGTRLYALWVEGDSFRQIFDRRAEIVKRLVAELRQG
ncbi:MAG: class D beta-lactamase [Verrucomicrobia bacterium]|nr:class D beta-lactamase [Verrucomicrobiota bacterium]